MPPSDLDLLPADAAHIPPVVDCAYPVRGGNLVGPLVDGVPTFRRIGAAIEAARGSVWLTVTFFASDFRFPDSNETVFDVLDRAVARGLDVRVLFWRPNAASAGYGRTFGGGAEDLALLRARDSRFHVRWDRAPDAFCQHQKSWLIDAGRASETVFVGGMNLTATVLGSPGHGDGGRHDVYVEITGPSATDVHHNFVQRWNEASERGEVDGVWGGDGAASLAFPGRASPACGSSVVQIQRMVPSGRYSDDSATPGGRCYDIAAGERSILHQYERAIDAARSSIYIENQALPIPVISQRLERALQRGVTVVVLVPAEPEGHVYRARLDANRSAVFVGVEALAGYEAFTLAGLITQQAMIYVHAKVMLVDDAWATIGSCNLHTNSLSGHTEMNASIWDPVVVRALRCALLDEHLGVDTRALTDREALRLYGSTAQRNRQVGDDAGGDRHGLAFALDPARYGMPASHVV